MAVTYNAYTAFDDSNNTYRIVAPAWDAQTLVTVGGFFPNVADYNTSMEALNASPPIQATWFVATSAQKTNMILSGFQNVIAVRDELINNNITKIYFNEAKTKYMEFRVSGNDTSIRFYDTAYANYSLGEYRISDAINVDANNKVRVTSMVSNSEITGSGSYGYWTINNVGDTGIIYIYASRYYAPDIGCFSKAMGDQWWNGLTPVVDPSDPYSRVGESDVGGGEGDVDNTSDDIEIPDLPEDSAADSRFITLFNPTLAQLQNLAAYMWSSSFDLNTFKKLFADPMDCILGLSIVPVEVPDGGAHAVVVGNISTGVVMTTAASQYVEVDCGTLNVNEYWGAYLDYEPYTKAEIYLPYIGIHAISVDDIMNKAVHVVYHVDILSGACAAYIEVDGTVLYQFIGQCAASIPITGRDWTNMVNGVLSIAGAIGSMVATGGASAPMASGVIASTAVNMMKPNIEKSGSMSGAGGLMAIQTPYLILTRPRQAVPKGQNKYMGYPSFITVTMDSLDGYTEVEHVHLENMSATANEITEIENLLKSGVIF